MNEQPHKVSSEDILLAEHFYINYSDFLIVEDLATLRLVSKECKSLVECPNLFNHTIQKRAMLLYIPLHIRFPMRDSLIFRFNSNNDSDGSNSDTAISDGPWKYLSLQSGHGMYTHFRKHFNSTKVASGTDNIKKLEEIFDREVLQTTLKDGNFVSNPVIVHKAIRISISDDIYNIKIALCRETGQQLQNETTHM